MNKTHWWRRGCILLLLLVFTCSLSIAAAEETSVWDLFQQKNEVQEGYANIELIPMGDPVKLNEFSDGDITHIWNLTFYLAETNGVGFTIESERTVHFDKDHNTVLDVTSMADEIGMMYYTTYIEAGGFYMFNDSLPKKDNRAYVGKIINGTDDNGHKLSFTMLMELSQEVTKNFTMADFAPYGTEFQDILFTPMDGSVLKLNEMEDGMWWIVNVAVCNTSSEPMTIKSMDIAYFNTQGVPTTQLHMDGKAAAMMCQGGVEEVPANSAFLISDWSPNGDLSAVGLKFELVTPQGEVREGTLLLELSKELATE